MTFDEWFKDYIDNSSNKMVAMSYESQKLAKAAWEAALELARCSICNETETNNNYYCKECFPTECYSEFD